ncbi:hypothetical protein SAMN04487995_2306 [Dyadobacter koreensis]|uniref:Uncharacterized protein n=1 Tax=Dyadobacter koreensis TaxID=408657 RepID=A0A1H6TL90_9BACT|nr:hypothetical protein SAMN04487995_2306 [Dyadobacter koreensis]
MNNRVRICLLLSNLAYLFVSSIGVKLTLPNFFFLPVCLIECSVEGQIFSFLLLTTWCCLWFLFFRNKAAFLPVVICQIILLVHVVLLTYHAVLARGAAVLLSILLVPHYIFLISYLFIGYQYYVNSYKPTFQNSK